MDLNVVIHLDPTKYVLNGRNFGHYDEPCTLKSGCAVLAASENNAHCRSCKVTDHDLTPHLIAMQICGLISRGCHCHNHVILPYINFRNSTDLRFSKTLRKQKVFLTKMLCSEGLCIPFCCPMSNEVLRNEELCIVSKQMRYFCVLCPSSFRVLLRIVSYLFLSQQQ